jgi:hypothetical protein
LAYAAWLEADGPLPAARYAAIFAGADAALAAAAAPAALVVDALDARGDARLARQVEEHAGGGCLDGLFARSLALQHADAFALVRNAFLTAPPPSAPPRTCGCQAHAAAPSAKQRETAAAYAEFLDHALAARDDADAERELRNSRRRPGG